MKRTSWRDSFVQWCEEPLSKLMIGLFVAVLVVLALFIVGLEPKPLAARFGLGPSWGARWDPARTEVRTYQPIHQRR